MEVEQSCEEDEDGSHEGNEASPELKISIKFVLRNLKAAGCPTGFIKIIAQFSNRKFSRRHF